MGVVPHHERNEQCAAIQEPAAPHDLFTVELFAQRTPGRVVSRQLSVIPGSLDGPDEIVERRVARIGQDRRLVQSQVGSSR